MTVNVQRKVSFTSYTRCGFRYRLLQESKRALMFELKRDDGASHYEVWVKRVRIREYGFSGRHFPAGSILSPSQEQFGKIAWTYYGLQRAKEKFEELNDEIKKPHWTDAYGSGVKYLKT